MKHNVPFPMHTFQLHSRMESRNEMKHNGTKNTPGQTHQRKGVWFQTQRITLAERERTSAKGAGLPGGMCPAETPS